MQSSHCGQSLTSTIHATGLRQGGVAAELGSLCPASRTGSAEGLRQGGEVDPCDLLGLVPGVGSVSAMLGDDGPQGLAARAGSHGDANPSNGVKLSLESSRLGVFGSLDLLCLTISIGSNCIAGAPGSNTPSFRPSRTGWVGSMIGLLRWLLDTSSPIKSHGSTVREFGVPGDALERRRTC